MGGLGLVVLGFYLWFKFLLSLRMEFQILIRLHLGFLLSLRMDFQILIRLHLG